MSASTAALVSAALAGADAEGAFARPRVLALAGFALEPRFDARRERAAFARELGFADFVELAFELRAFFAMPFLSPGSRSSALTVACSRDVPTAGLCVGPQARELGAQHVRERRWSELRVLEQQLLHAAQIEQLSELAHERIRLGRVDRPTVLQDVRGRIVAVLAVHRVLRGVVAIVGRRNV